MKHTRPAIHRQPPLSTLTYVHIHPPVHVFNSEVEWEKCLKCIQSDTQRGSVCT